MWQDMVQRIAVAVASTGRISAASRIAAAPSPGEISEVNAQRASVQVGAINMRMP
jgi:hypothetical protein